MAAKHELKSEQSHAPDFATCPWPSLCEQSELQCWRPRFSLRGRGPHFASKVSYSAIAPDFRHALQVIDSRPKVKLLAAEGKATRGRR